MSKLRVGTHEWQDFDEPSIELVFLALSGFVYLVSSETYSYFDTINHIRSLLSVSSAEEYFQQLNR